ncbi:MAG: hypothetical protein HYX27_08325 [Acidobacteria bacterium]|nr:hypothetical protein [Acidobacteriota bacterium]
MKGGILFVFSALAPLTAQDYSPLTGPERLEFFAKRSYGVKSLAVSGPILAGWRTLNNHPEEWGPHWDGFGKRYGARLVNNSVSNAAEISSGAIWGEDPRYFRLGQGGVKARLMQAVKQTAYSRYSDGQYHFGAAKAVGITTGSFYQKLWMPDSATSNSDCMVRIGTGYLGRFISNGFAEFGPGLLRKFKRKKE